MGKDCLTVIRFVFLFAGITLFHAGPRKKRCVGMDMVMVLRF